MVGPPRLPWVNPHTITPPAPSDAPALAESSTFVALATDAPTLSDKVTAAAACTVRTMALGARLAAFRSDMTISSALRRWPVSMVRTDGSDAPWSTVANAHDPGLELERQRVRAVADVAVG
jgi:hypothetical protein